LEINKMHRIRLRHRFFIADFRVAIIGVLVGAAASFALGTEPDARVDFLKLIDRPRVPLESEEKLLSANEKLAEYHFTYAADAKQRVPGVLVKPTGAAGAPGGHAESRRPVVIALHGTGGKKTDELPLLRELALKGFIGVAIDGRYHGERSPEGKGAAEYQKAIAHAFSAAGEEHEHPFYYDTVWDVMRLIDYLETRPDVDKARIGLYGVSKGGIETYLTAAVDLRVAVVVPCIGMESFRWALDHNSWQSRVGTVQNAFDTAAKTAGVTSPDAEFVAKFYDRLVPGIAGEFDGPAMIVKIAPRPLMTINGDSDPRTPLAGLKLCTDAAQAAYHAAGADDHFVARIQEKTGHKVNPDSQAAAIDWFVKWLAP
jgi:dienelactone hydrolase